MTTTWTRDVVARLIDHTNLKPEATPADFAATAREAAELGCFGVCVPPSALPLTTSVAVVTVCGFPSGNHTTAVKVAEAVEAVGRGAGEIDLVAPLGRVLAGEVEFVEREVAAVREAVAESVSLKVIIESAALTDAQVADVCRACEAGGADWVKTSTGFHPAGGATPRAVEVMRRTVGDRLGVKASGGIRTTAAATAMLEAGANRLGLSGSRAVLAGFTD
ncbi:deoxyribose-phosphate aldolase [Propionibacteriaceae bacterium Y2011]|uniref:deoxyribose-phosphate aldolase n=1 Tax=Microlunatus sp. Y2014 TaxID=3418488 RepID=UPI003B441A87